MEPEPTQPATSLEIPFSEQAERSASTELTVPPDELALPTPDVAQPSDIAQASDIAPAPVEPPPEVAAPAGPLGNLVVAHFRRVEIAMLARVLITTLGGALPASMVRVERRRSLGKRLTGRAGEPIGISITAGDTTMTFRSPVIGVTEASIGHTVRGVVLSSTPVPIAQWFDELGELLERHSRDDEAVRLALEQALG